MYVHGPELKPANRLTKPSHLTKRTKLTRPCCLFVYGPQLKPVNTLTKPSHLNKLTKPNCLLVSGVPQRKPVKA